MKPLNPILKLAPFAAFVFLTSCYNSVNFHQKERLSIALEASGTDPQQPIQGTIGVRNRTVLVAPGKSGIAQFLTGRTGPGESSTVVSDFQVLRTPGSISKFRFGTTKVNSAFITGKAAKKAPAESAAEVTGLNIALTGDTAVMRRTILNNFYNILRTVANSQTESPANRQEAADHLGSLNELNKLTPSTADYNGLPMYTIRAAGTSRTLEKLSSNPAITAVVNQEFRRVLDYLDSLQTSINAIEQMKNNRAITFQQAGGPVTIDDNIMTAIESDLDTLKAARSKLFNNVLNSAVIDSATRFVTSYL